MCTIIVARNHFAAAPLVIAANRDEAYHRPSASGQLLDNAPRVVGGLDLERGGTWMGLSESGLFVGLTNLGPAESGRRSRGELVRSALRATASEVPDLLAHGEEYTPFNLVWGTPDDGMWTFHSPLGLSSIGELPSGISVVPSGGPTEDSRQPKVRRAHRLLDAVPKHLAPDALVEALKGVLEDREAPEDLAGWGRELGDFAQYARALQALWVQTPSYGTRSSTIALLGTEHPRYLFFESQADHEALCEPTDLGQLLT